MNACEPLLAALAPLGLYLWTLGGAEIALIVLVLIFFFGAKRIPEIARGFGRSISEFKKGKEEGTKADETKREN
jgi:sec-independent protein translocase protein TatA